MTRQRHSGNAFSLFAFQDIITSICGIVVLITLILALELSVQIVSDASPANVTSRQEYKQIIAKTKAVEQKNAAMETEIERINTDSAEIITMTTSEIRERIDEVTMDINRNETQKQTRIIQLDAAEEQVRLSLLNDEEYKKLLEEKASIENQLAELKRAAEMMKSGNYFYFDRSQNISESPWLVDISGSQIVAHSLAANATAESRDFSNYAAFFTWARTCDKSSEYFVLLVRPSGLDNFKKIEERLRDLNFRLGIDFIGESRQLEVSRERTP